MEAGSTAMGAIERIKLVAFIATEVLPPLFTHE
jgi:hypothetical protein